MTTATETEICGIVDLVEIGKVKDKSYAQVTFFAGYRMGAEVLLIGGASAKSGVLVTCKVPWDAQKKIDDARLRKELPKLLQQNPEIKRRFPKLEEIKLDDQVKFDLLKKEQLDAVKKAYPLRLDPKKDK